MKHKVRMVITIIALLLFPIIMNFLSPVLPIVGAMDGIIVGSLMLFAAMFVTGIFFGRAWCSWLCPMSALGDLCTMANSKAVNVNKLRTVRFVIVAVWAAALVAGFVLAGGIKGADFLYMTESGISVDMPIKYVIYYTVLILFFVTNLTVGKRGACHSYCWMSPFLAGGYHFGKLLKVPQLRIKANTDKCTDCGKCSNACPMSIPVSTALKQRCIDTSDCILCGECVKSCSKTVLSFGIRKAANISRIAQSAESKHDAL